MQLSVSWEAAVALAAAVRRPSSREAVGFGLGRRTPDGWLAQRCVRALNSTGTWSSFRLDAAERRRADRAARAAGLEVALVYHSHPGGRSAPSAADLRGIAASDIPWVIVTAEDAVSVTVRAFAPVSGAPLRVCPAWRSPSENPSRGAASLRFADARSS